MASIATRAFNKIKRTIKTNKLTLAISKYGRLNGITSAKDIQALIFPGLTNKDGKYIKSKLPGLLYGRFRNLNSWYFDVNKRINRFNIRLISEQKEVLNFNHVIFWVRNENDHLVRYQGKYSCTMSSCAKALPDPNAVMRGDRSNTVSVHSKRELQPWWEVSFPGEIDVVCVEIVNRKDVWGKRLFSAILTGYNADNKQVYKFSNAIVSGYVHNTLNTVVPALEKIVLALRARGHNAQANSFLNQLNIYMNQKLPGTKELVLEEIHKVFDLMIVNTPDIGASEEQSLKLSLGNHHNYRFLRLTSFRRRLIRDVNLTLKVNGQTHELSESELLESDNERLLNIKRNAWALPAEHVFSFESETPFDENIQVWANDQFATDAIIMRTIEVSEDGIHWKTVDSTLADYENALSALSLTEWIIAEAWTPRFVNQVGEFLSTYRMHMTRTFKRNLSEHREHLPTYYDGVKKGGATAQYLPNAIFTRHGLSIPFSEQDSGFLALRMFEFAQLLEKEFGLQAFPCYGTLLGIYRDKDFLPHDDDIDLATVVPLPKGKTYREATMDWVKRLETIGIKSKPPTPTSLNLHCYFKDCDMDLFFVYSDDSHKNHVMTHMEGYKLRKVKKSLLLPLTTHEFMGHDFYAPHKIEAFLEDRYGKGWVSPDPYFEL